MVNLYDITTRGKKKWVRGWLQWRDVLDKDSNLGQKSAM